MIRCPDYYRIPLAFYEGSVLANTDVLAVIDGLGLNFNLGCVLKYVVRHGRKPGVPALEDLEKAQDCLSREIGRLRILEARSVRDALVDELDEDLDEDAVPRPGWTRVHPEARPTPRDCQGLVDNIGED